MDSKHGLNGICTLFLKSCVKAPKGSESHTMTDLIFKYKIEMLFFFVLEPKFYLAGKTFCRSSEKTRAMNTSYLGSHHHRAKGKAVRKAR